MQNTHSSGRVPAPTRRHCHPRLEVLEDRSVLALAVTDLTGGLTPQALAQSLAGSGVTISNVTYQGNNLSAGEFSGGTGILGIESGVVLSTGHAKGIIGPNVDAGGTASPSFDNGLPGDSSLAGLAGTTIGNTFDATVLEFNFVPVGNTISFNYVFGSEEYNEFVNAGFNDVFGFFLNGQNVALVPGSNTAVGVDTVNLTTNPQFYVNNATGSDPNPATPPLLNTDLDGLTKVLTVTANVNPGVVNHIKLAIADTGDGILDSDVMIQSGSFTSPPMPQLEAFRPFRYAFRSLEQNEGQLGPLPVGGPANVPTYDGLVTVVNVGNGTALGPVTVTFRGLPVGVQLVNATGLDATTGDPFITVPVKDIPPNNTTPLRIPVKFTNPLNQPLGTFFLGPYFIDVSSS